MAKSLSFVRSKSLSHVFEKGVGGRHSDAGFTVAVFGGTGQIGRNLLTRMGREGVQAIVPHRISDKKVIHFKPMADLGQFNFVEFYDIRNDEATEKIVEHADVVVNCVGRTFATRNYALDEVHVTWPEKLSKICKKYNKERFVHLSAYGAHRHSESLFLKLKAAGEAAVKQNFPESVIIRPARVFGRTDDYITLMRFYPHIWGNYFMGKKWGEKRPVLKIPIHVGDVGQAVLNACRMPKIEGQTFELFGPDAFYLRDLFAFVMEVKDYVNPDELRHAFYSPKQIRQMPLGILKMYARAWDMLMIMGEPPLDKTIVELDHQTEVPTGLPGIKDLGIERDQQGKLFDFILDILRPWRTFDSYFGTMDDVPHPTPVDLEKYLNPDNSAKRDVVGDIGRDLLTN